MKRASLCLFFGVAALALAQQGSIFFEDADKNFSLRDFEKKSLSFAGDRISFSGTGKPLTAEMRSSGLLIQGNEMSGEGARSKAKPQSYVLEKAEVAGAAVLIFDSTEQQKYLLEKKRLEKPSASSTRNRFDSASFSYNGSETAGTLTVPSKMRLRSDSQGTQDVVQADKSVKKKTYARNLDMTGSSGIATFYQPVVNAYLMLEGGTIQGPVQFTLKSTEQTEGDKEPTVTDITGQADLLTFNFKGETKTITFSGNVRIKGTGATYSGEANASSVVITLDETLQPLRYDLNGDPATTKVKQTGGGR